MTSPISISKKYFVHIVAVDENYGIGYKDRLLFKIPADLEQFKKLTYNHTVVGGTKTIKTLPELRCRKVIQLSRSVDKQKSIRAERVVNNLTQASCFYSGMPKNFEPIFIIGGGEVYKETLNEISVIILTRIFSKAEKVDTHYFDPLAQQRRPLYMSVSSRRKCKHTGLEYQFEIYGYQKEHLKDFLKYKHSIKDLHTHDIDPVVRN